MKRARVFSAVLLTLVSCKAPSTSYYPLQPGRAWHYRLAGSNGLSGAVVVTNLPARLLHETKVVPQRVEMWKQVGIEFIGEDDGGIYLAGKQVPSTAAPQVKSTPSYVLRPPFRVGATWEGSTETHMWFPNTAVRTKLEIRGTAETVTVAAGTFAGCVLVEERGDVKPGGGAAGPAVAVLNRSWFAPGVGIVKAVLHESVGPGAAENGTLTFELESYTK